MKKINPYLNSMGTKTSKENVDPVFFAYFPKVGLCNPYPVCESVYPPSTFECLNQSL
jgi:hypothetical protein